MKKVFILLCLCGSSFNANCSSIQGIEFIDSNLLVALINHLPKIDKNDHGIIQVDETEDVKTLNLRGQNISDVQGTRCEAFVMLRDSNNQLSL